LRIRGKTKDRVETRARRGTKVVLGVKNVEHSFGAYFRKKGREGGNDAGWGRFTGKTGKACRIASLSWVVKKKKLWKRSRLNKGRSQREERVVKAAKTKKKPMERELDFEKSSKSTKSAAWKKKTYGK